MTPSTTPQKSCKSAERAKATQNHGRSDGNRPQHASIQKKAKRIPPLYRQGYLRAVSGQASPRQAIKAFCLECICWQRNEIELCPSVSCPLYPYRPFQND